MGKLYYLMGKSASGKDKLYKLLMKHEAFDFSPVVLYTTRPKRTGEREGVQYHFIVEDIIEKLKKSGKLIELRRYDTVLGPWYYMTVDDENMDLENRDYLAIGTLESFVRIRKYYGADKVIPIYIEVEDGLRLERALTRERKQEHPHYEEMCRRFLADQKDFSEEKLAQAGIVQRFENNGTLEECLENISEYIRSER